MQYMGDELRTLSHISPSFWVTYITNRGYQNSCSEIVSSTRTIANTISSSISELYVLGSPPASVVAFASQHPLVNILEVGDAMAHRGWHLNALSGPAAVHIAVTVSSIFDLGHGCVHCGSDVDCV
jgi:hypothetical protein